MIKRHIFAILVFIVVVLQPACADYLTFHADGERTGNVSGTGPEDSNVLWSEKLTTKGYIGGGAVICEDSVYASSWPDMSYKGEQGTGCLNAEDGSLLWLNTVGGKGGASTPAVQDGLVFTGSWNGGLYCLDAATGDSLWNRTLENDPKWWGVASSPLAMDGEVFVTSFSEGTLHVLDFDGNELWNTSTGKIDPYTSPAGGDDRIYFVGGDPALYCVERSSEERSSEDQSSFDILWKFSTDDPITSTPAVENDIVYFATRENIYALDATSGTEIWNNPLNGTISSPAISFGRVYIGSDDASFYCFNSENGSLIWSKKVDSSVMSSPLVVGDMVYFGTNKGIIYALDASDGSEVWTYETGAYMMSSPSFSDGVLYIGSDDGHLYAFGKEPSKVIFEGEVLLGSGSFNVSATSGRVYSVDERSAFGALKKASETGGFNFGVDDSLWDDYGLLVESINDIEPGVGEVWSYWVNYPEESMPSLSPDRFSLEDEDVVTFYLGNRSKKPEDSLRIEIKTVWV